MSAITYEKMMEIMRQHREDSVLANIMNPNMLGSGRIGGLDVYERNKQPAKLKLSSKLDLDPAFRAEYDRWLLDRFGLVEDPYADDFWVFKNNSVMVTPPGGLAVLRSLGT